jgi:transcriptional regulator with XRE-family HTH domain
MKTWQVSARPPTPAELIRLSLGFRRRQIASLVGIASRTLERVERGVAWGRPETLQRIAEVLGVELEAYVIAVLQSWRQTQARQTSARR